MMSFDKQNSLAELKWNTSENQYLVTVEDLLISKLIWIQVLQSAIQIEDLKNLSELNTLDWDYINKWVKTLNI